LIIKGSKGYKFDQNGSLITFQHEVPSIWLEDSLVFGIETYDKNSVLFRTENKNLKREITVEIVSSIIVIF
jgi:hypothetical protein